MKFIGFTGTQQQSLEMRLADEDIRNAKTSDHILLVAPDAINTRFELKEGEFAILVAESTLEALPVSAWIDRCEAQVCLDVSSNLKFLRRASKCARVLQIEMDLNSLPSEILTLFAEIPLSGNMESSGFAYLADWLDVDHFRRCLHCRSELLDVLSNRLEDWWDATCPGPREIGAWLLDEPNPWVENVVAHLKSCVRCRRNLEKQIKRWVNDELLNSEKASAKKEEIDPRPAWLQLAGIKGMPTVMGEWFHRGACELPGSRGRAQRLEGSESGENAILIKPDLFAQLILQNGWVQLLKDDIQIRASCEKNGLSVRLSKAEPNENHRFSLIFSILTAEGPPQDVIFEARSDGVVQLSVDKLQQMAECAVQSMRIICSASVK